MAKLPDFEGMAIFAKVVEIRSFAGAAADLKLSKATVSKAVSRIEARLGARLINRSSRRFALTDAGRQLAERAAQILAAGEAAEDAALAQATSPRGLGGWLPPCRSDWCTSRSCCPNSSPPIPRCRSIST
jgi:DNA-binding transcriptional LysR family regulator